MKSWNMYGVGINKTNFQVIYWFQNTGKNKTIYI